MKQRSQIVWSKTENDQLLAMVDAGQTPARAAVKFNRSMSAVQSQARKLGKAFPKLNERRRALKNKIDGASVSEVLKR